MPTAYLNGVELFYEVAGEGVTVVLTHGAWTDGRTWQDVAPILAERFQVLTWDRRGHSRSGDDDRPGSCREDAADLAALLEHLGKAPAHVVGNSAGGNVALNLVASRPELVATAAAHEPGPFAILEQSADPHLGELIDTDKRHTEHVVDLVSRGEHDEAARYFVDEVAVGPGAWDQFPPQLRRIMVSNAETVPDDIRDGWDIGSLDVASLADSEAPLLISTGSVSPAMEAAAAVELARRLPRARLESVDGAGHIPHRTHPDAYAGLLIDFIERKAVVPDHVEA